MKATDFCWIKPDDPNAYTPLHAYRRHVYFPFVGSVIAACNECEYLLVVIFKYLDLDWRHVTLGRKKEMLAKDPRIRALLGDEDRQELLAALARTNNYFNLVKHAYFTGNPDIADDPALLQPHFDFDQVDLYITDVSNMEVSILGKEDRHAIYDHISATRDRLVGCKQRIEISLAHTESRAVDSQS